jgi:hypothetical protein
MPATFLRFIQSLRAKNLTYEFDDLSGRYEVYLTDDSILRRKKGVRIMSFKSSEVWSGFDDERERELVTAVNLKTLFS